MNAIYVDSRFEANIFQMSWSKAFQGSKSDIQQIMNRVAASKTEVFLRVRSKYSSAIQVTSDPHIKRNLTHVYNFIGELQTYTNAVISGHLNEAVNPLLHHMGHDGVLRSVSLPADYKRPAEGTSPHLTEVQRIKLRDNESAYRNWRWDVQFLKNYVDLTGDSDIAIFNHPPLQVIMALVEQLEQELSYIRLGYIPGDFKVELNSRPTALTRTPPAPVVASYNSLLSSAEVMRGEIFRVHFLNRMNQWYAMYIQSIQSWSGVYKRNFALYGDLGLLSMKGNDKGVVCDNILKLDVPLKAVNLNKSEMAMKTLADLISSSGGFRSCRLVGFEGYSADDYEIAEIHHPTYFTNLKRVGAPSGQEELDVQVESYGLSKDKKRFWYLAGSVNPAELTVLVGPRLRKFYSGVDAAPIAFNLAGFSRFNQAAYGDSLLRYYNYLDLHAAQDLHTLNVNFGPVMINSYAQRYRNCLAHLNLVTNQINRGQTPSILSTSCGGITVNRSFPYLKQLKLTQSIYKLAAQRYHQHVIESEIEKLYAQLKKENLTLKKLAEIGESLDKNVILIDEGRFAQAPRYRDPMDTVVDLQSSFRRLHVEKVNVFALASNPTFVAHVNSLHEQLVALSIARPGTYEYLAADQRLKVKPMFFFYPITEYLEEPRGTASGIYALDQTMLSMLSAAGVRYPVFKLNTSHASPEHLGWFSRDQVLAQTLKWETHDSRSPAMARVGPEPLPLPPRPNESR